MNHETHMDCTEKHEISYYTYYYIFRDVHKVKHSFFRFELVFHVWSTVPVIVMPIRVCMFPNLSELIRSSPTGKVKTMSAFSEVFSRESNRTMP